MTDPRQSRPCHSRLLQIRFVYRLRPLKGLRAPYQHSLCLWRASSPIVGHAPPFVSRAHNPITVPGPLRPGAPIVSFLLASQVLIYTAEHLLSGALNYGSWDKTCEFVLCSEVNTKKINLMYDKIKIVSIRLFKSIIFIFELKEDSVLSFYFKVQTFDYASGL